MPTFRSPPEAVQAALDLSRLHLESGQKAGATAGFAFESLTELRLDDTVLTDGLLQETDFSRCSLVSAQVCSATANGAIFSEADVSRANFKKSSLIESVFDRVVARGTRFQSCSLTKAVFDGADLQGASFEHAVLTGVSFRSADLRQVNLTRATVRAADFTAANLEGVVFDSTLIDDSTRFDESVGLEKAIFVSVITDEGVLHADAARVRLIQIAGRSL